MNQQSTSNQQKINQLQPKSIKNTTHLKPQIQVKHKTWIPLARPPSRGSDFGRGAQFLKSCAQQYVLFFEKKCLEIHDLLLCPNKYFLIRHAKIFVYSCCHINSHAARFATTNSTFSDHEYALSIPSGCKSF